MSTLHTPGPWEIGHNGDGTPVITRQARDIAVVEDYHGDGDANARLIAAAPDLFWIAERFLQCRRNSGDGEKGSVRKWTKAELERSFADLETHCRAAIAKATTISDH